MPNFKKLLLGGVIILGTTITVLGYLAIYDLAPFNPPPLELIDYTNFLKPTPKHTIRSPIPTPTPSAVGVTYGSAYSVYGFSFTEPDLKYIESKRLEVSGRFKISGQMERIITEGTDEYANALYITIINRDSGKKEVLNANISKDYQFEKDIILNFGSGYYEIHISVVHNYSYDNTFGLGRVINLYLNNK